MQECFCFSDHSADVYRKYHQAQHDHGRRAPCPYHRQLVERNGEKYVVLTHLDSGSGYFEEDLEYLNRPVSQQVHDFDGKKIGTYNLLKRLYLVYGEKAHAHFSNEPGWGARSEVTIPYIPYREDGNPPESKIETSEPLFSHASDTPQVPCKRNES